MNLKQGLKRLFRSDFSGVFLYPAYTQGGQWWQHLGGPGWSGLPGTPFGFQPMVAAKNDPTAFVRELITRHDGPNGRPQDVILQLVMADDPDFQGIARSNYFFQPDAPMFPVAYQRSAIYLQPNLVDVMTPPDLSYNWRTIWELKYQPYPNTFTPAFRLGVNICHNRQHGVHWRASGQHDGTGEFEFHVVDPGAIAVPAGRWFELEVLVKQHESDGRFVVAIDGDVLVDWRGLTMVPGYAAHKWNPMKCYANLPKGLGIHWQYVTDLELWGSR